MVFLDPQKVLEHFNVAEGMHVADFGSGAGHFTYLLAHRVGPYGRVYAFDNDEELLSLISNESKKNEWGHIRVIKADLALPEGILSSEKIDRVLVANTVFLLKDKSFVFSHAYRILKNGGKMIVIDWKARNGESEKGIGPRADHLFTEEHVEKLASLVGFVKEKNFFAGDHHYGLVFRKM